MRAPRAGQVDTVESGARDDLRETRVERTRRIPDSLGERKSNSENRGTRLSTPDQAGAGRREGGRSWRLPVAGTSQQPPGSPVSPAACTSARGAGRPGPPASTPGVGVGVGCCAEIRGRPRDGAIDQAQHGHRDALRDAGGRPPLLPKALLALPGAGSHECSLTVGLGTDV